MFLLQDSHQCNVIAEAYIFAHFSGSLTLYATLSISWISNVGMLFFCCFFTVRTQLFQLKIIYFGVHWVFLIKKSDFFALFSLRFAIWFWAKMMLKDTCKDPSKNVFAFLMENCGCLFNERRYFCVAFLFFKTKFLRTMLTIVWSGFFFLYTRYFLSRMQEIQCISFAQLISMVTILQTIFIFFSLFISFSSPIDSIHTFSDALLDLLRMKKTFFSHRK